MNLEESMKTYIARLSHEHNEKDFVKILKNELQDFEVCYKFQNVFYGELVLKKVVKGTVVTRVYHLTDFTCDFINMSNTESTNDVLDSKVKKLYFSFMNRHFSDYKSNYLKNVNVKVVKTL